MQSIEANPQFNIDVAYAYVGPRKKYFSEPNPLQDKFSIDTLYARSLYPSIVYFNVTHVSNADTESCDAKIEIYLIQITSDKGSIESYTYIEGTNYKPSFAEAKLTPFTCHISDFVDTRSTNGFKGYFTFNWTTNTSYVLKGVGSLASYTSRPSGLGLWAAGQPNAIYITIRRLGWIVVNGTSTSTLANTAAGENIVQVKLEKFGDGFLYSKTMSQYELSQIEIDPFHPPV